MKVDLRRLDLALAQVLVPRLKLADHVALRQEVQVTPHRGLAHAKRARGVGGVPDLPMDVGEHRPESHHGWSGDGDAELRQVDLHEARHGVTTPGGRSFVGDCSERRRVAAAQRQGLAGGVTHLGKIEAAHFDDLDSAEQRFAGLAQQGRTRRYQAGGTGPCRCRDRSVPAEPERGPGRAAPRRSPPGLAATRAPTSARAGSRRCGGLPGRSSLG